MSAAFSNVAATHSHYTLKAYWLTKKKKKEEVCPQLPPSNFPHSHFFRCWGQSVNLNCDKSSRGSKYTTAADEKVLIWFLWLNLTSCWGGRKMNWTCNFSWWCTPAVKWASKSQLAAVQEEETAPQENSCGLGFCWVGHFFLVFQHFCCAFCCVPLPLNPCSRYPNINLSRHSA